MSFELHCRCGKALSVTESMAGGWVRCECGQDMAVPSLRDLRAGKVPSVPDAPAQLVVRSDLVTRAEPAANDQWKLPCACGNRIRITPEMAGTWVCCVCGRNQAVPTLHQLRARHTTQGNTDFLATRPPPEIVPVADSRIETTRQEAQALIAAGKSDEQILDQLADNGMPRDRLAGELEDLRETYSRDHHERARWNIFLGIVWLVLGATFTLQTLALAVITGSGIYLLAWGAMLGGTIQLFVGLFQLIDPPEAAPPGDDEPG